MDELFLDEDNSGYRAGVYSRTIDDVTDYVFANAGSDTELFQVRRGVVRDNSSAVIDDWLDNAKQPFGESAHMKRSISDSKELLKKIGHAQITFVGHSKGGAEAAGNALANNKNAILYNPAAISSGSYGLDVKGYSGNMSVYVVKGDFLDLSINKLSKPIDRMVKLPRQSLNPFTNHSPVSLRNGIQSVINP